MITGRKEIIGKFIEENQPVTVRDIYGNVPFSDSAVRAELSVRYRRKKELYIDHWQWYDTGKILKAIPAYAFGNKKDAPKPKPRTRLQNNQRYQAKKAKRVSSIFTLAVPLDYRRLTSRKRPDATGPARAARRESLEAATGG